MLQTFYSRPYSMAFCVVVLFLLGTVAVTATIVLGIQSAFAMRAWFLFNTVQVAAVVLDPNICVFTTTTNRNGLKVKIKRPLIGFARCETQKDIPDNNEDQSIPWRWTQIHEQALLRVPLGYSNLPWSPPPPRSSVTPAAHRRASV